MNSLKKIMIIMMVLFTSVALFGCDIFPTPTPLVYVDSINCISEYYEANPNPDGKYNGSISQIYRENLKVLIKCTINPENATQKDLAYSYDTTQTTFTVTINADGTAYVNFLAPGSAYITVKSTDNRGVSIIIRVDAIDLSGII